jgi:hypothetical protein
VLAHEDGGIGPHARRARQRRRGLGVDGHHAERRAIAGDGKHAGAVERREVRRRDHHRAPRRLDDAVRRTRHGARVVEGPVRNDERHRAPRAAIGRRELADARGERRGIGRIPAAGQMRLLHAR